MLVQIRLFRTFSLSKTRIKTSTVKSNRSEVRKLLLAQLEFKIEKPQRVIMRLEAENIQFIK